MRTSHDVPLAERTTLRLGGPALVWVDAETEGELIDAVADADDRGERLLILGGGSNVVAADEGFDGTVIAIRTQGVTVDDSGAGSATVDVASGVNWDDFVVQAVEQGWAGVEALSGIPGQVGATPIQNVGAYGQEVAETVVSVRVWDRHARAVRTIAADDCGFGYRSSRFKANPQALVVLSVRFRFPYGDLGAPIKYSELARYLGVEIGERVAQAQVRDAVLDVRRSKGMVLDDADHDTWSAGSFFTNPILTAGEAAAALPDAAPRWPQDDGRVKTSAAWLIEHAGFSKGYRRANVALSGKHTLALTNRGGGTTAELLALAREIRTGVRESTAVTLVNEPVIVGGTL
ncbi:MAG: UDP-N-acetylmuramate dehydrogenase [Propionibacteriales bacterium]|nr:UDP-N-acetylmuramate dehydrogenase [Propionibacteriales bacterium]